MSDESGGTAKAGSLSRGDFLKRSGAAVGGVVLGGGLAAEPAWARPNNPEARDASVETITIGYVSPLTGADAGFGEPDPYVISLAKKAFDKGFKIAGKTYKVNIINKDAQSSPSVSAQVTQQLISGDNIDLLLATSTPEVVLAAVGAAEAAGVPAVSTTVPWQGWWLGSGNSLTKPVAFQWIFHFSFGVGNFFDTYTDMWPQVPTNKTIGVMYPNDSDAVSYTHLDVYKRQGRESASSSRTTAGPRRLRGDPRGKSRSTGTSPPSPRSPLVWRPR